MRTADSNVLGIDAEAVCDVSLVLQEQHLILRSVRLELRENNAMLLVHAYRNSRWALRLAPRDTQEHRNPLLRHEGATCRCHLGHLCLGVALLRRPRPSRPRRLVPSPAGRVAFNQPLVSAVLVLLRLSTTMNSSMNCMVHVQHGSACTSTYCTSTIDATSIQSSSTIHRMLVPRYGTQILLFE